MQLHARSRMLFRASFSTLFGASIVVINGLLSGSALAQTKGQAIVSPSTGLLQIFLALVAVIGLMLLIAWLFKRIGPINSMNKVPMKVVGGLSIGNRERIMVVEVGDQWLVLGVTAQQINTLSSMPKQVIATSEPAHANANPENQFSHWLKKTLDKRNTPET
jgi:flagellar protein FliO/FliZ